MDRESIIKTIRAFAQKSSSRYGIQRIGIFGSVARGEMRQKSDVDIVVTLYKQDLFNLIGIKQDLEETLHTHVDIVSYRESMNPFLKKRIDEEAVYV